MAQANFSYEIAKEQGGNAVNDSANDTANDSARMPFSVAIFADRAHLLESLRDDCAAAGLQIGRCGELRDLLGDDVVALDDLILLDCPQVNASDLAAISRLDMRAARSGVQMVVSTSVDALDDVFACLDQSNAQILVDPTGAERVIALGRALALFPGLHVRELNDEDRLTLLRLTEQVGRIAERLDRLSDSTRQSQPGGRLSESGVFRFESPAPEFHGQGGDGESDSDGNERLVRAARPPLPDPRLIRRILRQRQLRARFFDGELFADPAWDILLDLTAARVEHTRVSVTSLCIASGVPPTTALRWIGQMSDAGLLERIEDEADRRRAFIALSDKAADAMARYFAELGKGAAQLA